MHGVFAMEFIKKNKGLILSILSISLPVIIEMSLHTLVGIADTLMISHMIGKDALSAAGYANQVIFATIFVFSSFNIGATAMISRSYGEKNHTKLNQTAGQNLTLNLSVGFIMTIFALAFGAKIMGIFDTTDAVFEMGLSYFNIVSYSMVFMFIAFAAASSLRGVSDTRTPMIVSAIVNFLNIIGNYVLITGFGPFPVMGIQGAALSTTLSRVMGAVIYIILLLKGSNGLRLFFRNLKITSGIIKPLWNLSYTAGIEQLLLHTSFIVAGLFISFLDTTSEAAYRILLSIESLSTMPAIGFSIAAATLVGKALGEEDKPKALHTSYIASGMGILWGILIGTIFIVFPAQIIRLFTPDIDIIQRSIPAMRLVGIDQPFLVYIIIMFGSLRGAGDTKNVMILNALRLWGIFIPVTYMLIVFGHMGIESVWISELISLAIFSLIVYRRLRSERWMDVRI